MVQPARAVEKLKKGGTISMKYRCVACSYVYDEEKEGVPFKKLPKDWVCPTCGAPKSAFYPVED